MLIVIIFINKWPLKFQTFKNADAVNENQHHDQKKGFSCTAVQGLNDITQQISQTANKKLQTANQNSSWLSFSCAKMFFLQGSAGEILLLMILQWLTIP